MLLALPAQQRHALESALLRADVGDTPLDSRAVATGALSLLRELALSAPLLLAVDDAQWLDAASAAALGFAVRRLDGLPVGVLTTVRIEEDRPESFEQFLPRERRDELEIAGLGLAALHAVLKQQLGRVFPRPVLVRIAAASAGNPFYALEIGRELDRMGVPPVGAPLPVPREAKSLAQARLRRLPDQTFEALLAAASLSRPHVSLLDAEALGPAEESGLVTVADDGGVRFSHPLVASAVYESASAGRRRRVHRTLAERVADPEEHARHLALAATGPDEQTARALDRAAELVAGRGAVAIAVELKGLALRLTSPDDADALARRRQELAQRLYFAGDASAARRELAALIASLPAGERRAEALLDLGSVVWSQGENEDGLDILARALAEAESHGLRARIHSRISLMAEDCDLGLEHGKAALQLIDEQADPLLYSFALHNVARWKLYAGGGADHEAIERGIRLQREAAAWEMSAVPAYWARDFDDFETAKKRFEQLLLAFQEQGDEARRCVALAHLAVIEAMTGHLDRAGLLAAESRDLAEQTEQETWINIALWAQSYVAAQAGDVETARAGADAVLGRLEDNPDAIVERLARDVLGITAFAAGDYEEADRQLSRADDIDASLHVREPAAERFQADHAEAVIALGDLDRAERLVRAAGGARRADSTTLDLRGVGSMPLAAPRCARRSRRRAGVDPGCARPAREPRDAGRAGANPPGARAGAPQAEAAAGGARGLRGGARRLRGCRSVVVGAARTHRACARPCASRVGRAHSDGGEDCRPRCRRSHEPCGRGADLRESEDRGGEPRAGLPQAGHPLARRAWPRDGGAGTRRRDVGLDTLTRADRPANGC